MKESEDIKKLRGLNLKCLLDRCNLKQKDLCIYGLGLYPGTISAFIKGDTKTYITKDQAYKLRDVFRNLKKDFPEKNIIVPRIEYLLGEDPFPTEEDMVEGIRKDKINKYGNAHAAIINMFKYSLSKKEIDTIINPWTYDDYRNQGYDDQDIMEMYQEAFEQSDCQENDFPISVDTKTKKIIMFSQFQYYMKELEEFSDYLIWKLLNLPREKTIIKPFTMEHYE